MKVQTLIDTLQLHCKPDDDIFCENEGIGIISKREGSVRLNPRRVHMFETTIYPE